MPHLLFELGCEELPAGSISPALDQLVTGIKKGLIDAGITFGEVHTGSTPRRLIVGIDDLPARQPDGSKETRGPSVKAAFDADGNPTKALEGFVRGQGATIDQIRTEGDYVVVTVHSTGKATSEVLAEVLPASVRTITFDKTMRWGTARMRFARPIRWIVATLDGEIIPFNLEAVSSSSESRGHRFTFPESFAAKSFEKLVGDLRRRDVEPDPEMRRQKIEKGATAATALVPDLPAALVDENVHMTEWPVCHEGTFAESFMELPEPVIVTAMAKHERFFPVRDAGGNLTNRFVAVRNTGDEATVRASNEWVLNARLNDAKFFYDEDKKSTVDEFLIKTERMIFQEGLGSVRQRADRLSALCDLIAGSIGAGAVAGKDAGKYAKFDLATGLVGELASLQGVVGGIYATKAGLDSQVCQSIQDQYLPIGEHTSPLTISLILADQIDKLVGFVGIGLLPSGSSDPYGLRRAATIAVECAWSAKVHRGLVDFIDKSRSLYAQQQVDLHANLMSDLNLIFTNRYESLLNDHPSDVVRAAISHGDLLNPINIRDRARVAQSLKSQPGLVQTFSRAVNIIRAAEQKGIPVTGGRAALLTSSEELDLAHSLSSTESGGSLEDRASRLAELAAPTDKFFDTVMVMAEDPEVRLARLTLVAKLRDRVLGICDISQLTFPGIGGATSVAH